MNDGYQYGDIIFLGLIAIFVALRLRSMLGKNHGIDPREAWKPAMREAAQDKGAAKPDRFAKKPAGDEEANAQAAQGDPGVASGLKAIRAADANFSTTDFLSGAKLAFEWVVDAFSRGDRDKLKILLSDERYRHFAEAIDARGGDGLKHETTLVAVLATDITEAQLQAGKSQITVQFTSEQVHVTRDASGAVVEGDLSATEKVIDVWTFERDVNSRDPNWKIVAT